MKLDESRARQLTEDKCTILSLGAKEHHKKNVCSRERDWLCSILPLLPVVQYCSIAEKEYTSLSPENRDTSCRARSAFCYEQQPREPSLSWLRVIDGQDFAQSDVPSAQLTLSRASLAQSHLPLVGMLESPLDTSGLQNGEGNNPLQSFLVNPHISTDDRLQWLKIFIIIQESLASLSPHLCQMGQA